MAPADNDDRRPRYLIESVDHAARLLLLLEHQRELRVTDAAREIGIAASTTHRLLTTLQYRGLIAQDRMTKSYRAGPKLVEIGVRNTSSIDLRQASEPHLKELAGQLGLTVNLVTLQGGSVRFIAGFESNQQVRTHVLTGTLLPAYATSGGKVLLAELSREALRELYPRGLKKLTPRTKTFTQLVEELSLVMMRGFALNRGESEPSLVAVAVPLRDRAGRVIAAVASSAPAENAVKTSIPRS